MITATRPSPLSRRRASTETRLHVALAVVVVDRGSGGAARLDIWGWVNDLWDAITGTPITEILAAYVFAGAVLKTPERTLTAFSRHSKLHASFPGWVRWLRILASYAARETAKREAETPSRAKAGTPA